MFARKSPFERLAASAVYQGRAGSDQVGKNKTGEDLRVPLDQSAGKGDRTGGAGGYTWCADNGQPLFGHEHQLLRGLFLNDQRGDRLQHPRGKGCDV